MSLSKSYFKSIYSYTCTYIYLSKINLPDAIFVRFSVNICMVVSVLINRFECVRMNKYMYIFIYLYVFEWQNRDQESVCVCVCSSLTISGRSNHKDEEEQKTFCVFFSRSLSLCVFLFSYFSSSLILNL